MNHSLNEDGKKLNASYGNASLKAAVMAFAILWLGGKMYGSVLESTSFDVARFYILSIGAFACLAGFYACILGLLSLFGFGKQAGKSHPIRGFFGMLVGLVYGPLMLVGLLLPALQKLRDF